MSRGTSVHSHLEDETGASIVIALVFFLICAVIGSVVLTAASVQAKAVQTHREMQQAEFTVGSAAGFIGSQLKYPLTAVYDDSDNLLRLAPVSGETNDAPFFTFSGRHMAKRSLKPIGTTLTLKSKASRCSNPR